MDYYFQQQNIPFPNVKIQSLIHLWLFVKKTTASPNPNQNFAVESFLKRSVDELIQSELNLPTKMWRRVKLDFKKEREVAVFWQKSCKLAAKELEIQQNAPVKFELKEAVNDGTSHLTRECYNMLEETWSVTLTAIRASITIGRSIEMREIVRAKIILLGENWLKSMCEWTKPNYFLHTTEDDVSPVQKLFITYKCEMLVLRFENFNPLENKLWRRELKRLGRNIVIISKTSQPLNWPSNLKWLEIGTEECREVHCLYRIHCLSPHTIFHHFFTQF